jgi:hypothetical protein
LAKPHPLGLLAIPTFGRPVEEEPPLFLIQPSAKAAFVAKARTLRRAAEPSAQSTALA